MNGDFEKQNMYPQEDVVITRPLPTNDLDLNLMLTNSLWGSKEVPFELRDKLKRHWDERGNPIEGDAVISKASLWGLLGFFTRDMRLGNLSSWDNELQVCRYHIDLANDLLNVDMVEPFLIALSRSATMLETSQSKSGFLRRMMNTIRQEHIQQQMEPPKKKFFGGQTDKTGGGF